MSQDLDTLALERARKEEGLRLKLYLCPKKRWTIGYGRNIQDKGLSNKECMHLFGKNISLINQVEFLKDKEITKEQAEYLLKNDVQDTINQLIAHFLHIYRDLNAARKLVLIDMCFNMGLNRFGKFNRMILALEMRDFEKAAIEILDSDYARDKGTAKRAKINANIMESGVL